ncbi:aminotransferase class III-fold pyridoxal phosphate-dependent enzyme [Streptomyces sp. NPDC048383]|uniref:aminotransferase class III-fold pyridoxal phosphate-dependent enzyme n=1 Tax=Streptomyces sp. NPDC048383 TaxID=3155386 RepID=UPI0034201EA3
MTLRTTATRRSPGLQAAAILPDIVCLAKSNSGYAMPMALTLLRLECDACEPGEHSATFRGYKPAFVAAAQALELCWSDRTPEARTTALGGQVGHAFAETACRHGLPAPRGCGLARGLPFIRPGTAREVCDAAFRNGLLLETAGVHDQVVKLRPPLTAAAGQLERGLKLIDRAVAR